MTKIFKKFTLAIVTVCLLLTGVLTAACQPETPAKEYPAKDGYTITVLYPDGTPVRASDTGTNRRQVRVTLTDDNGDNIIPNYEQENMGILSDDGTSTLNYKIPGVYNITVYNIPEGYAAPEAKTNADTSHYTVNLVSKNCTYDVTVKLPDGSAAAGLNVKLLDGAKTVADGRTDDSGKYTTPAINAGEYDVVVTAPEGKNYNHKPVTTTRSGAPVEVKLFETTIISPKDENRLTDEQYESWARKVNSPDLGLIRIKADADNYLYSADVYGDEETFFILHADKSGTYKMTLKCDEDENGNPVIVGGESYGNYIVKFYVNGSYGQENEAMRLDGNGNGGTRMQILSMKAGDDFIFSVSSIDKREHYSTEFVISYEKEASTTEASGEGTYAVTYNDIDEAILAFSPDKSGKYQLTSLADSYDPRLVLYSLGTNKPVYDENGNPVGDDNGGEEKNFLYIENVPQSYVGNTYYYHIFIDKMATAAINVKIERLGDADEGPEIVTDVAEVKANLVKQNKQQGTWTWLDENDEVTERSGEYFVTVDGSEKQVYVAITKNFFDSGEVSYSFATIEYMGSEQSRPGSGEVSNEPGTDRKNDNLTVYEIGSMTQKYNYTDFIKTYAEYCDANDGVYPMNGELKTFVERYMSQRWFDVVDEPDPANPPKNLLKFACGYFA